MRHLILGAALVAALGAAPAIAAEKPAMKSGSSQPAQSHAEYKTDTMLQNEDGTLQGKPVVEGPADWSSLRPDSASTGASSGESGSASEGSGSAK